MITAKKLNDYTRDLKGLEEELEALDRPPYTDRFYSVFERSAKKMDAFDQRKSLLKGLLEDVQDSL